MPEKLSCGRTQRMRLLTQGLREGEEPEKDKHTQTSHEADNIAGFFT